MDGRFPDFLGLGVQKGGTTSLHCLLAQHPDVFLPAVKEVHYFSLNFAAGQDWYGSQFAAARPEQHCGEITPYYIFHPEVPRRAHAFAEGTLNRLVTRSCGACTLPVFPLSSPRFGVIAD